MNSDTIKIIEKLSMEAEQSFMALARLLRDLIDAESGAVQAICSATPLKKRRIYCLARIARVFDGHVDDARLTAIGWTKLDVLAPHVNSENMEHLLRLAEANPPAVLLRLLTGAESLDGSHTIQLTFSSEEYAIYCRAIEAAGAKRKGKGYVGKESALIEIFRLYIDLTQMEELSIGEQFGV